MKQENTSFSLKDKLFNKNKVQHLAELIFGVYPELDQDKFVNEIVSEFPKLELMDRIHHIVEIYKKYLPTDYPEALSILLKSLPPELDPSKNDDDFGDFIYAPYSHFVAKYGCEKQYLNMSLDALKEITKRFSSEFAIRSFINNFEDETYATLLTWSTDENYHVRRLSSEGSRPNLPWGNKISLDYKKTIPILDNLYSDDTRFVTRSVANHLNDVSKKDPKLVTDTLKKWKKQNPHPPSGTSPLQEEENSVITADLDYIIFHSTRTLVKLGDHATLELLGYSPNPQVSLSNFKFTSNTVSIGTPIEFSFDISCDTPEKLIIDYKLYFINKAGKLAPKVFKIKKSSFIGTQTITKKHPLKLMTTKALYPGQHFIEIMINGKSFEKKGFELI